MERRTIWTLPQIARLTGRNEDTVGRWIRSKRLLADRPAGGPIGYRVRRRDLDRFCRVWLARSLAELEAEAGQRDDGSGQDTPDNPRPTP